MRGFLIGVSGQQSVVLGVAALIRPWRLMMICLNNVPLKQRLKVPLLVGVSPLPLIRKNALLLMPFQTRVRAEEASSVASTFSLGSSCALPFSSMKLFIGMCQSLLHLLFCHGQMMTVR